MFETPITDRRTISTLRLLPSDSLSPPPPPSKKRRLVTMSMPQCEYLRSNLSIPNLDCLSMDDGGLSRPKLSRRKVQPAVPMAASGRGGNLSELLLVLSARPASFLAGSGNENKSENQDARTGSSVQQVNTESQKCFHARCA